MSDRTIFLLTCLLPLAVLNAAASGGDGAPPPRPGASAPNGPPPEAIAACAGKTQGASVTFTGRRGETFNGVCRLIDGVLVAAPPQRQSRTQPSATALTPQLAAWLSGR